MSFILQWRAWKVLACWNPIVHNKVKFLIYIPGIVGIRPSMPNVFSAIFPISSFFLFSLTNPHPPILTSGRTLCSIRKLRISITRLSSWFAIPKSPDPVLTSPERRKRNTRTEGWSHFPKEWQVFSCKKTTESWLTKQTGSLIFGIGS